jgi:hypothetical protein
MKKNPNHSCILNQVRETGSKNRHPSNKRNAGPESHGLFAKKNKQTNELKPNQVGSSWKPKPEQTPSKPNQPTQEPGVDQQLELTAGKQKSNRGKSRTPRRARSPWTERAEIQAKGPKRQRGKRGIEGTNHGPIRLIGRRGGNGRRGRARAGRGGAGRGDYLSLPELRLPNRTGWKRARRIAGEGESERTGTLPPVPRAENELGFCLSGALCFLLQPRLILD